MKKILLLTIFFAFVLNFNVYGQAATTPATTTATGQQGMKLIDYERKVEMACPTNWGLNAGKYSIGLNHKTHYDAHVTLKKSWYTVATAKEAYEKRKASLKSYIPGAKYIKENETLTIGGNTQAMSFTIENPGDLTISREMLFIHNGQAYELVFKAKKENFQKVKQDFGYILKNMKLF